MYKRQESEYYLKVKEAETDAVGKANAVICLSEVSKNRVVECGADPAKVHVVPNSIDAALLEKQFDRIAIRDELGLGHVRGPLIGTVTSVVSYEGLHTLVRAMKSLPEEVKAVIVGDGDERPELEAFVERMGLTDRMLFVGRKPQTHIWKWYAALDVFVVPRVDSDVTRNVTPIKPLTAMALGVPVIASDLPALREVTGGFAGYFQAGDSLSLASAILEVIELGKQFETVNDAAADWLSSRTWDNAAAAVNRIYRSVGS